jgi:hypothetical protein
MAIPSQMILNDERHDDGDTHVSFHISFSPSFFLPGSPAKVSRRGALGFRPFVCCK